MCCQKAFHAFVTSGGWPTGGEPSRFSSAALCSLSSLHLSPLTQRLTVQLLRNGTAPIALDPGARKSGSHMRRSCSKGRWRYLTVPNSHSVRLHALLVLVCRVDLRSISLNLLSAPSLNLILRTGSDPFQPSYRRCRPFHCGRLPLPQALFAIQNP
jgi:hypothetical protein